MMDWNIQTRAHACQACGKTFADRQGYRTLLFEEPHGYVRQDVCSACWESQFSHGAVERKGFVSQWQGVYEKPESKPEPIARETAETLLRKLCTLDDPRYRPACFILAVMLERKRLLKVKAQSYRDGQRVFVYEHPPSGDLFTILDPNLQLDQLDQVQRDVAHLMEHGLADAPATAAASPSATPDQAAPAADSVVLVDTPSDPAAPPPTPTSTPAACV